MRKCYGIVGNIRSIEESISKIHYGNKWNMKYFRKMLGLMGR